MNSLRAEKVRERMRRDAELLKQIEAKESEKQRKLDTRRKVLVGAAILEEVEAGGFSKEKLLKILDARVTRLGDRQLFELPAIAETGEAKAPSAVAEIGEAKAPSFVTITQSDAEIESVVSTRRST